MKNHLHLVGNILIRVVIVLWKVSCTWSIYIFKSGSQICLVFRSVLTCQFVLHSCLQHIDELLSQPSIILALRSAETFNTVNKEQSQCLDWQSFTTEVLALSLKMTHQGKFYHTLLIGYAILIREKLFASLFLLTIAQADTIFADSLYDNAIQIIINRAKTLTQMKRESLTRIVSTCQLHIGAITFHGW